MYKRPVFAIMLLHAPQSLTQLHCSFHYYVLAVFLQAIINSNTAEKYSNN